MDIRIGYFIKSPIVNEIYSALKSNTLYEVVGITAQHVAIESDGGYRTILAKSKLAEQQWEVVKPGTRFDEVNIGELVDTGALCELEYYGVTKGKLYEIERVDYDIDSGRVWFFFQNDFSRVVGVTEQMWNKYGFSVKDKQEPQKTVVQILVESQRKAEMQLTPEKCLSLMNLYVDLDQREMFEEYAGRLRELEGAK